MSKKYKFLALTSVISMMMSIFLLSGCSGEKTREIPITKLIDLSPSNIFQIRISRGGGSQTIIENSKQIEKICSLLSSSLTLKNEYTEWEDPRMTFGGQYSAYFLIIYLDSTESHIRFFNGVQIKGQTTEGEIKINDKWRVYPLVNFSEQERLKLNEILSMKPVS